MAVPESTAVSASPDRGATTAWQRGALGLLLTPIVVGIAATVLPGTQVGEASADLIVFGGAASTTLAALAIAAAWYPPPRRHFALGALAAIALGVLAGTGVTSVAAAITVDAALVALAWAIGTSIGRRIEHPGHLLPACVVVASADAISTVSSFGPTHAIAASTRALSILAVSFPVPGTSSLAPALGVGDLVFVAIVLGAVAAHGLSLARAALLCWLGVAVAGALSAVLQTAVPALVPLGAAVVLGIPASRRLRPRDRRVANLAMALAVSALAATIAAQLIHGEAHRGRLGGRVDFSLHTSATR